MSRAKYADMPDIDTGPELYETPDLPPEPPARIQLDSDDEPRAKLQPDTLAQLNRDNLSPAAARAQFAQREQASRLLPSTTVYSSRPPTSLLLAHEEPESRLDRVRRLRSEMQQLEEDLERDLQEETLLAQGDGWKKEKGTVSARILLQQITLLRGDLKGVEGAMGRLSSAATPSGGGDKDGTRGTGRVSLSGRMKEMDEHDKGVVSAVGVAEVAQGKERVVGQGGGVGRKREPSNLRELEARITQLELNLGTSESTLDENRPLPPPLLQSVQSLTSLLSLLTQPRTLELVTRRIKSLIHDLEKLTESRKKLGDSSSLESCVFFYRKEEGGEAEGGMNVLGDRERERKMIPPSLLVPESPDEDDIPTSSSTTNASLTPMQTYQLNTLTSLVPSITPLVPLAPRLLSRLQSLKTLHSSAQEFNLSLSSLESVTSQTQSSVRGTTATMEVLEENMRRNEEAAGRNLEGLQGRIESLLGRLDALTSASSSKEY